MRRRFSINPGIPWGPCNAINAYAASSSTTAAPANLVKEDFIWRRDDNGNIGCEILSPCFWPMTDKIVVLSTCATEEDAAKLARVLVEARVAACVTLVPGARSVYRWQGAVELAGECLLIIKSSR